MDEDGQMREDGEFSDSVLDIVDMMRNDGGVAPEIPHRDPISLTNPTVKNQRTTLPRELKP
ncbi:MAG: hypothetical protein K6T83_06350 [Alicyclobacillus sp.]|nr:hypothetical protein [Alicyclobacillus sp.]